MLKAIKRDLIKACYMINVSNIFFQKEILILVTLMPPKKVPVKAVKGKVKA